MRVVLQRVSGAWVRVDGTVVASVDRGLLLLAAFSQDDTARDLEWMARKVVGLRIFDDGEGRMNHSLDEVGGGILVVSQFTLYGDARKGRRPSFVAAADPELAVELYRSFVRAIQSETKGPVEEGEFGAMMEVGLVNDGPVTLVLERGGAAE